MQASQNKPLHIVALLTAAATFPLIFMGGLVTSHKAGMSVPDWPNSYGYNMFLFPPDAWVGGIFYEHTHRLMGTLVGLLAIVLASLAWSGSAHSGVRDGFRRAMIVGWFTAIAMLLILGCLIASKAVFIDKVKTNVTTAMVVMFGFAIVLTIQWICRWPETRRNVRWLCVAALVAIIVQGVLGGLRVTEVNLTLAIVHGCFAQACFCLLGLIALMTTRWWQESPLRSISTREAVGGVSLARWAIAATAIVYCQLIVGATMRHYDAGLAIPDLPLNYGHWLPPMDQASLDAANTSRLQEADLHPVSLLQVWLHFGHRIGAVLATLVLLIVIWKSIRLRQQNAVSLIHIVLLTLLLCTQLTLGLLTVLLHKPADIASLHVAVGALVLITSFLLAAKAMKLFGFRSAIEPEIMAAGNASAGRAATGRQNGAYAADCRTAAIGH